MRKNCSVTYNGMNPIDQPPIQTQPEIPSTKINGTNFLTISLAINLSITP
ncbi:hypothetical protein OAA47_02125 [Methylophilaceae bacterium]|nr:hypothetical protein [Methylophilaceae bacterium]